MGTDAFLRQQEPWFVSLGILGALYVAVVAYRLFHISGLALCLRQPKDLRRRYGAWAVVTGPTSGIGRSMALELARRGLNLVLVGRDPAMLQDISATVSRTHGVLAKTVQFDFSLVSTPRGDEAMRRLREAVAGLDVGFLVNNAGVAKPGVVYLHEVDAEAWVSMIRVNLWALTEVTAAVLPGMVDRGRGAVVNIGSGCTVALPSVPFYSIYAATKRYVAQFSRSLYVEYRGKGIDVQCQNSTPNHAEYGPILADMGHFSLKVGRKTARNGPISTPGGDGWMPNRPRADSTASSSPDDVFYASWRGQQLEMLTKKRKILF
ncbi:very-long-chain 3-oxoacyl-CoA reductase 1-like isoform X2 [Triticum dicoccoides]|uniref:very-long-chain 3-oxoacyl-CoA reductase 1-like isoform X2 n=1 Tax=Triticum dicoccoides TaxID=85692 RepID=UPI001891A053|nr:very-long-chain 3-oxoacyl-CoA reductase 1-like isoform X2 [Triticum dicoccoides]